MGYDALLFFVPVAPDRRTWALTDAEDLIGDLYDKDRVQTGLRSSVSRNGWHVSNVRQVASALHSSALDFLEQNVACLDTPALAKALQVLAAILAEASGGPSEMATTCTAGANEFFLQQDKGADIDAREVYTRAFLEARPSHEVEWTGDAGYAAGVGYFAFLKSLLVCLTECLNAGKHLLYYRPPW